MAVHHFSAPDVVVARGWQPMETFPRDGTQVEVTDASGTVCLAQWMPNPDRVATQGIRNPTSWRYPE